MAEKKDQHRIHIILDDTKVNRCKWCGSPQSDDWISSKDGAFCSKNCARAAYSEDSWRFGICLVGLPFFMLLALVSQNPLWPLYIFMFPLILIYYAWLFCSGRNHAKGTPKGSRRNTGLSAASLLRRVSAPIECPNCDAKIDLKNVGEDMIYHCQYCGASGVVDIDIIP